MIAYSFYDSHNCVVRYAEALANRGDHVDVFSLQRPTQGRRDLVRGVNVHRLQERKRDEKHTTDYFMRINRFFLSSSFQVTKNHLLNRYDVVHVHSVPDFLAFAAWLPRLTGAGLILDMHDLVPELYQSKFGEGRIARSLLLTVEKICCRISDAVIVPTEIWRQRVAERSTEVEKISVFMTYPDAKFFQAQSRPKRDQVFKIIYPGTLLKHQGLDIALRALQVVILMHPEVELHIYGDGTELPHLRGFAQDLDIEANVCFHEPVPVFDVPQIMAHADLGIVPKRADGFGNEAFSTKILEFMAVGVPVVIANTLIDSHYFNDKVVQFFKAGSSASLADAIIRLIENRSQREILASNAQTFVNDFRWDVHKDRYCRLVDQLASG